MRLEEVGKEDRIITFKNWKRKNNIVNKKRLRARGCVDWINIISKIDTSR